jgi:hypothetical protein
VIDWFQSLFPNATCVYRYAKDAVKHMREAVARFETLGQNEFIAATYNRIALTLIADGKHAAGLCRSNQVDP